MTVDGKIKVCPHCDSSELRRLTRDARKSRTHGEKDRYYCQDCQKYCHDPVRREPYRKDRGAHVGLSRRLIEADPDDVGGIHDG